MATGHFYLQGKQRLITDDMFVAGASFTTRGVAPILTAEGILRY